MTATAKDLDAIQAAIKSAGIGSTIANFAFKQAPNMIGNFVGKHPNVAGAGKWLADQGGQALAYAGAQYGLEKMTGGGAPAPGAAPAPGVTPMPGGHRQMPPNIHNYAQSVYGSGGGIGWNRMAEARDERFLAFTVGIDRFAKEAGFDEADKAELYNLIKLAFFEGLGEIGGGILGAAGAGLLGLPTGPGALAAGAAGGVAGGAGGGWLGKKLDNWLGWGDDASKVPPAASPNASGSFGAAGPMAASMTGGTQQPANGTNFDPLALNEKLRKAKETGQGNTSETAIKQQLRAPVFGNNGTGQQLPGNPMGGGMGGISGGDSTAMGTERYNRAKQYAQDQMNAFGATPEEARRKARGAFQLGTSFDERLGGDLGIKTPAAAKPVFHQPRQPAPGPLPQPQSTGEHRPMIKTPGAVPGSGGAPTPGSNKPMSGPTPGAEPSMPAGATPSGKGGYIQVNKSEGGGSDRRYASDETMKSLPSMGGKNVDLPGFKASVTGG